MDPERMAELLQAAQRASRRGVPLDRLDQEIESRTGGEYTSVRALASAADSAGVDRSQLAPQPEQPRPRQGQPQQGQPDPTLGEKIAGGIRLAQQGATFGLADEGAGILAGAGAALVPGGQGFEEARRQETERVRQGVEQARQDLGILGTAAEIGGAAALPVGGAYKLVSRGPTLISRILRGALAGAVEGGAYGFGTAEGTPAERLPATGRGAAIGAPVGAGGPVAISGARAFGRAAKGVGRAARRQGRKIKQAVDDLGSLDEVEAAERTIGPDLAGTIRKEGGILGKPSRVRSEIAEQRRGIFGELDEIEEVADERLQRVLQREDVEAFVPEEVAQGSRPPSFVEAQGAARQMAQQKQKALQFGDAASFQRLTEAEREVRTALDDALGGRFSEANEAFAQQAARGRALEAGEESFSKTADEIQEAFGKLDTEAEQAAFREGLASRFLSRLEDNKALPSTLKKFQNAPETRAKLRVLLPDDESFEAVVDAARRAEDIRERAKSGRVVQRELLRQLTRVLPWAVGAGGAASILFD